MNRRTLLALAGGAGTLACSPGGARGVPVAVGLIAPFSGRSAASGVAIQRGMVLAAGEANASGGALGRPLTVVTRDVHNDPAAGDVALRDLVREHHIVTVFGGIYSPVMMRQLDTLAELRIPLINAWGSVTTITKSGRSPNFAFRTGISDEIADEFLVRYAVEIMGARRAAIMVDTSAWGASNLQGLTLWLRRLKSPEVGIERFDQGDTNMSRQLERLRAAGSDAIIMVADTAEGAAIVRGMGTMAWRVPVVSHWGVSGGQFVQLAGPENAEGVLTLQTFTFQGALSPKAQAVLHAYHARFGTRRVDEIAAPIGVAHGYDGMHLLAQAINKSHSLDGESIRSSLERLDSYDGLMKRYAPPFTPENHDPLTAEDVLMAVWRQGRLVPATPSHLRG